jgi:hypothetical protein
MLKRLNGFVLFLLAIVPSSSTGEAAAKRNLWKGDQSEFTGEGPAVMWLKPADIASRDLFYGSGGREHQPQGTFAFVKEDLDGSSPKFVIKDQDGVKWKVKLGAEARPETAASRLVWAVGYFTNEDYFLPMLKVNKMPQHLHRGRSAFTSDGTVRNVRLKRYLPGEEKIGNWRWSEGPFTGARELDGLRVMMALINNWDLKDVNNAIYQEKHATAGPEQIYMVSDLGASFAGTSFAWPVTKSKGNLHAYMESTFIRRADPEYIDFNVPTRPSILYFFFGPRPYVRRVHLGWIGKHIPRDHAKWTGELLAQLSQKQIRDAFRAAGYNPEQVEGFSKVVEHRIAELNSL